MFDRCRECQLALNFKKCICCSPFEILLGHVVCKQGPLMDPTNISTIVILPPRISVQKWRTKLVETGYFMKFTKGYSQINNPMEKDLKKDNKSERNEECQHSLDLLKEKMVIATILVFLDWKKEFHVHVDASTIYLGTLTQPREEDIDHAIDFSNRKLSSTEKKLYYY